MDAAYCISLDDVQAAADRIRDTVHKTPVMTSASLIEEPGMKYFFKVEALQRTGSFKFRGALNAVRKTLEESPKSVKATRFVAHSSGNHAQALALAAKLSSSPPERTVSATIVMPRNAPLVKKSAVEAYGATVVMVDNTNEAREEECDRIIQETGATFVHPSEDPRVIAGQGTASLEMVEQVKEMGHSLDVVVIPVGGGGLASGNTIALRGLLGDKVKIVLAEPERLNDAYRSFHEGKLLKHLPDNNLDSVADGLKTTLGPNTWPIVQKLVDDIFVVSEKDILQATKRVWERLKVCIEPSAGVGVAVASSDAFKEKYCKEKGYANIGIILCGGNVDLIKTTSLMASHGL